MQTQHEMFVFIASYHALTSSRDPEALRARCRQIAIDYLAFGLDPSKTHIYLQHQVPEVTELAWMLSCVASQRSGTWTKRSATRTRWRRGLVPNVGLYTYPDPPGGGHPRGRRRPRAGRQGSGAAHRDHARPRRARQQRVPRRGLQAARAPARGRRRAPPRRRRRGRCRRATATRSTFRFHGRKTAAKADPALIKTDSLGVDDPKDPEASATASRSTAPSPAAAIRAPSISSSGSVTG